MTPNNAYAQYKENSVITSSPEELTLMLYQGLVKFLMQAQTAIAHQDYEKAHTAIMRSQDIVAHLQATLDMKYEVSATLDLLYDYMNRRLIEANIKKDGTILEEVLGFAKEFRDIWAQAMKLAKKQVRNPLPAAIVNDFVMANGQ